MPEIKCPNCGEVFQIDESNYDSIVKQVRDHEFNEELARREKEFKKEIESAVELAKSQTVNISKDELNNKDLRIKELESELKTKDEQNASKVNEVINSAKDKINELQLKINEVKTTNILEENNDKQKLINYLLSRTKNPILKRKLLDKINNGRIISISEIDKEISKGVENNTTEVGIRKILIELGKEKEEKATKKQEILTKKQNDELIKYLKTQTNSVSLINHITQKINNKTITTKLEIREEIRIETRKKGKIRKELNNESYNEVTVEIIENKNNKNTITDTIEIQKRALEKLKKK